MGEIITNISETFDSKRVYFYECDYKNRLKLSEILKLSAELAGHDYTEKGLSHEFLWENGMVFLVSKVSFHIFEYPKNQDKLLSSTWEKGKRGAMFLRGFEIRGAGGGRKYVEGTAGWVLVNPKTRHIIKPKNFPYNMPQIMDRECKALDIGKISSKNLNVLGKREVRLSDLDGNGHVYNGNYADMAVDVISQQLFEQNVENFRINFISEAILGDIIDIYGEIEENKVILIGKICDKPCFETEIIFRRK
ncbi:MAG: hypothetical protein GX365_01015 [Clostridiales bacterium]|nr:hypothetical protein [Clostridiales bacterium]